MLASDAIDFYSEHGYLLVPGVFSATEVLELSDEMNRLMAEWAEETPGWTGDWRWQYMDSQTEASTRLIAMHDLSFYSSAWTRAVTHPRLVEVMVDLLGPNVELHHSTMHVKPPETGHPFPLHQDNAFYEHETDRYVDVLVHLDDTCHENGEIRFMYGSHRLGYLPHIRRDSDGNETTPYLPPDDHPLDRTVPVPAKRGDIVAFNILTIHGSYINTTNRPRRLVRIGYRDPDNRQTSGQSCGRPGLIVAGGRPHRPGDKLFDTR